MKPSSTLLLAFLLLVTLIPVLPLVEGETEVHDLIVDLTADIIRDTHNHLSSGNSTVLNASVTNKGDFSESNVTLQLLINSTIVLNATTPRLETNHTFWTAYFWTPDDADYNLTVYAPPVKASEDNITNNVITKWVRVCLDQPPIANFTFSPSSPPPDPHPVDNELITFNASHPISYDPDWGTILNYTWDFDDGNPITVPYSSITHKYTSWGNKTVTLTLWDTENLPSLPTSINIMVYARPIANFSIDESSPYFVNETLTFNATDSCDPDNSTGLTNGIAYYTWDFDDGNTTIIGDNETATPIITHTYTMEKDYNVTLTVTDYHELVSPMFPKLVPVGLGNPIADFTRHPEPCYACYPLTFDASTSRDPNNDTGLTNGIAYYTWDFDDGNTTIIGDNETATPIIIHYYQTSGTYNVNLTVTDYEALTDSINKTVTVSLEVLVKVVDSQTGNTSIICNPGQTFSVNITVANVENLYSFYLNLSWPAPWMPPAWLDLFDPDNIEFAYGGFLGPRQDSITGDPRVDWTPIAKGDYGYITLNATLLVDEPCGGDGTLATITFKVVASGNCTLELTEVILSESFQSITPIARRVENGTFYTSLPVASFTYWPEFPSVNQTIDFDASASYDPDNPYDATPELILNYTWNFGDGNITSVTGTPENPPSPTIPHKYENNETYTAILFVTDDDGETGNFTRQLNVGYIHDVAIIDVRPHCNEAAGILPIDVVVLNNGTSTENVTVTVYYDDNLIESRNYTNLEKDCNVTMTFYWNNQGVPKGDYTIKANATLVGFEINPDNNWKEDGVVRVYLAGDVNRDNNTNMRDISLVCDAFGSYPSHDNWNPNADLNCDGRINMRDISIACDNFMKEVP